MATVDDEIMTDSGIAIAPVYRAVDRGEPEPDPGDFPYTRGIYPTMFRGRRWTMRQYAGFSSVEESNARYRLLLGRGTTGLSVAFDVDGCILRREMILHLDAGGRGKLLLALFRFC